MTVRHTDCLDFVGSGWHYFWVFRLKMTHLLSDLFSWSFKVNRRHKRPSGDSHMWPLKPELHCLSFLTAHFALWSIVCLRTVITRPRRAVSRKRDEVKSKRNIFTVFFCVLSRHFAGMNSVAVPVYVKTNKLCGRPL